VQQVPLHVVKQCRKHVTNVAVYARANADNDWQSAKSHVVACVKNRTFVILALSYGVIGGLYAL
jgi:hypothetical protein